MPHLHLTSSHHKLVANHCTIHAHVTGATFPPQTSIFVHHLTPMQEPLLQHPIHAATTCNERVKIAATMEASCQRWTTIVVVPVMRTNNVNGVPPCICRENTSRFAIVATNLLETTISIADLLAARMN
ncbi:hypothetical protein DEO72_LG10g1985 [Vigna unguiculata]|uniref:Uncharacterized protein n=1 Tax=Vigna unguiculata TaxID=3917 RepID=A0A4D6NA81_VIGUN|nr:hypothetical protein DEO72_LG10g1985 [Vigna unguiculata]